MSPSDGDYIIVPRYMLSFSLSARKSGVEPGIPKPQVFHSVAIHDVHMQHAVAVGVTIVTYLWSYDQAITDILYLCNLL